MFILIVLRVGVSPLWQLEAKALGLRSFVASFSQALRPILRYLGVKESPKDNEWMKVVGFLLKHIVLLRR